MAKFEKLFNELRASRKAQQKEIINIRSILKEFLVDNKKKDEESSNKHNQFVVLRDINSTKGT